MKKQKIFILLLLFVFGFTLVGCVPPTNDPGDDDPDDPIIIGDKDKIYEDDEIPTPNTDQLELTADYVGKNFKEDGIGEVKLVQPIDGDTAIFKLPNETQTFSVRFMGIDTPESTYKVEPWGFAASDFTAKVLMDAALDQKPIVLQADSLDERFDSTGDRWLAWVWVDGRLLNLELVEKCYTPSKAAGTIYADEMLQAGIDAQNFGTRIWNSELQDPDYDYDTVGTFMTLRQLHETYNNTTAISQELDKGKKVRVQGIVTRKTGKGTAYIQQQEEGYWYFGETNTEVIATNGDSSIPYIGDNGNWFIDDTDLGIVANGDSGKTAYDLYKDSVSEGNPMTLSVWKRSISVENPDGSITTPYIVRPLVWYGMYLYGGFNEITDFVVGREIITSANIGYYQAPFSDTANLQLTGMSDASIQIISLGRNLETYQADSSTFINKNRRLVGSLIEIENLTVMDGYNSADSNGFTITVKTADNTQFDLRIPDSVFLYTDNTKTTRITEWEYYQDVTFSKVIGIIDYYNGEFQIIVSLKDDLIIDLS